MTNLMYIDRAVYNDFVTLFLFFFVFILLFCVFQMLCKTGRVSYQMNQLGVLYYKMVTKFGKSLFNENIKTYFETTKFY